MELCVTLWNKNPPIKRERGEGRVTADREAPASLQRRRYTFWASSRNTQTLWKSFNGLAHTEGVWLSKDFDFWAFIKWHFPSDAREAVWLPSQPGSEWNGCWQFRGVRKSSCGRGIMPRAQRSCAVLPGWVCVQAGTQRMLSWHEGRCPETRFPSQTQPNC